MFSEQDDLLLKLAETELPNEYFVQSAENDKKYWLPFAKIRMNFMNNPQKNELYKGGFIFMKYSCN